MSLAYYIEMPLDFPAGVHFGAGKQYNWLAIARDGTDTPVLNGTSLAGVMRTIWRDYLTADLHDVSGLTRDKINDLKRSDAVKSRVARLFGRVLESKDTEGSEEASIESRVKVTNYELQIGEQLPGERTHHLRNRHRGTVAKGGLYSLESCPPGTSANVGFWIYDSADAKKEEIETFLDVIIAAFQQGVCVGGNSNRGIGRAQVNIANVKQRVFNLSLLDDQAAHLDAHLHWRLGELIDGLSAYEIAHETKSLGDKLTIDLTLIIPRGQDILVGDGLGLDYAIEPQRITCADGSVYWRLPGSSLRGLFRGWMTRLAARDGHSVDDSYVRFVDVRDEKIDPEINGITGDNLGWSFVPSVQRKQSRAKTSCPVASLFGTLFQPGRIKISDGFSKAAPKVNGKYPEEQTRMHVAINQVTGGASEGMLFSNSVLTANKDVSPEFPIRIQISFPSEHEADWLAKTLKALHIGLLRVGSSKSAGRLEWKQSPRVVGPHAQVVTNALA